MLKKCKVRKYIRYVLFCIVLFESVFYGVPGSSFDYAKKASATSKTAQEAISWVKSKLNTQVNDGECVGLITAYYEYLGVSPVRGNGKDYAINSLPAGWSRVQGGTPQLGDILVYSGSGDNSYGHVAIFESARSTYHQNYAKKRTVQHVNNVNYNGFTNPYWGYIRPNWSVVPDINHNPEGNLEAVEAGANSISIRGWTFDRDNLSASLDIHVYIGGGDGGAGGEVHAIRADQSRQDVNQVHACGEYHGFNGTITTYKRGRQEVWVYAINVGAGVNVLLGHSAVVIPNSPIGDVDEVSGGKGSISVRGWAFDVDQTSQPLTMHVYIGGPAGSDTGECHGITADKSRKDVHQVFACGESHGYEDTIQTDKSGTLDVYIYAINVGQGENVLLGKKTVTIEKVSVTEPTVSAGPLESAKPSESSEPDGLPEPPTAQNISGDINQDGKIDGKDISMLLQYRLNKRELTEAQIAAGDVYKDGKIDGKDVSKLLQYRLGKISSLD